MLASQVVVDFSVMVLVLELLLLLLLLALVLVLLVVVLLTGQLLLSKTVGVIDEELTSLTFFCAMAFKDTAVSEAFIAGVCP